MCIYTCAAQQILLCYQPDTHISLEELIFLIKANLFFHIEGKGKSFNFKG